MACTACLQPIRWHSIILCRSTPACAAQLGQVVLAAHSTQTTMQCYTCTRESDKGSALSGATSSGQSTHSRSTQCLNHGSPIAALQVGNFRPWSGEVCVESPLNVTASPVLLVSRKQLSLTDQSPASTCRTPTLAIHPWCRAYRSGDQTSQFPPDAHLVDSVC